MDDRGKMTGEESDARGGPRALRRRLSLTLITLYGLGTTIGAGIFVLVGKVAGAAGAYAPLSFLLASGLAALTALAFAELAARYPRSAGEAVYVREGLGSGALATLVGLLVAAAGLISAAAISRGFVGYLQLFLPLPEGVAILALVAGLGALAAWGIAESVTLAALFTLAEIGALLLVILVGAKDLLADPAAALAGFAAPPEAWPGVAAGAVLAFYAFIGFEDMVNVAEEVKDVRRTLPRAILLTLVVTALLYVLVAASALAVVTPEELAASAAPLALVYAAATSAAPTVISLVAVFAVINGALIQIIMASRVLYGLSALGLAPAVLGQVNARTRTPLAATALVTFLVLVFALALPLVRLAEITAFTTLLIFALVNLALTRVKAREAAGRAPEPPPGAFVLPAWLPWAGCLSSAAFALYQLGRFLSGA